MLINISFVMLQLLIRLYNNSALVFVLQSKQLQIFYFDLTVKVSNHCNISLVFTTITKNVTEVHNYVK